MGPCQGKQSVNVQSPVEQITDINNLSIGKGAFISTNEGSFKTSYTLG